MPKLDDASHPSRHRLTRRRLASALAGIPLVGACVGAGATEGSDYYVGPVTNHWNGRRFFNPDGDPPRGFGQLLRWQFSRVADDWPENYPSPLPQDVPPPRVEGRGMRVAFAGHCSFLIQMAGLNILADPVWSDRASPFGFYGPRRHNAPGIVFDALPRIDVVLVSHAHYDHLDVATLARLWDRDRPHIVAPLGNDTIIRGHRAEIAVTTLDWDGVLDLGQGVTASLEPVHHWSARGIGDRNHALWGGFVLKGPGGGIFFAGDTGFDRGRPFRRVAARHPGLDLALLPIGAYEPRWFMAPQHMNPDDAVQGLLLLGAREALGYHWGTFRLTDEPVDQPAIDLAAALAAHGVAPGRFRAARPGEVWTAGAGA